MPTVVRRLTWILAAISLLSLAVSSGCGSKDDLNKAKSVVETSLTHWKNGEPADKLVSQGIEIVDEDWKAGNKLLNFTIKSAASQPQQGPRVVVMLNMQRRNGKKVDTEIAYEVLMKDKVKIGRDAFHVPQQRFAQFDKRPDGAVRSQPSAPNTGFRR